MVKIDMPMPECCEQCPCSYWVQFGGHEGELMCEAIESTLLSAGVEDALEDSLVEPMQGQRPEQCPIVCEITEKRKKEHGQR